MYLLIIIINFYNCLFRVNVVLLVLLADKESRVTKVPKGRLEPPVHKEDQDHRYSTYCV